MRTSALTLGILICGLATQAAAAGVEVGVRVNIIQCGSLDQIEEACLADARCCVFLQLVEPAAGQAEAPGQDLSGTRCEIVSGTGAQDWPACFELIE